MRTIGGPFHDVQNECAVPTGARGAAEDIVSAPKGPYGRDRLGPNCFVTLETIRHPLSRGLSFVCHVWKMFSWNPCKTLLKKIVTVSRKLTTVYVRLPRSAACLLFVWQPCKVVPSQIGYHAVDSCRNPCSLDFTEVFLLIKAIYPSSNRLWHVYFPCLHNKLSTEGIRINYVVSLL